MASGAKTAWRRSSDRFAASKDFAKEDQAPRGSDLLSRCRKHSMGVQINRRSSPEDGPLRGRVSGSHRAATAQGSRQPVAAATEVCVGAAVLSFFKLDLEGWAWRIASK